MSHGLKPRFGETRTDIQQRHALLTPESHEWITQPEWAGAEFAVLISPDIGAKFSLSLVRTSVSGTAPLAEEGGSRFLFCLDGEMALSDQQKLTTEDFAFLPPASDLAISYTSGTRFVLFEWRFLAYGELPGPVVGSLKHVEGQPLHGDDWLTVQKMLPTDPVYDCEFNVMTFEPGASLAYVETHFMEHGLLFLDGGGIYRLDKSWYPVIGGDAIWMGPHAPQWFGSLGREKTRYLIYKNYNRSPLAVR